VPADQPADQHGHRPQLGRRRRPLRSRARPGVVVAPVLATVLAAAGCASVPSSGPVQEGREIPAADQQPPYIRVFPEPPRGGEDPYQIVDGFLDTAAASAEPGFATARQYLTPRARSRWNPSTHIVVVDSTGGTTVSARTVDRLELKAAKVGTVDGGGTFRPAATGEKARAEFGLRKVGGQWRIDSLPDGLYVSRLDFDREYRPFNVYYFDPSLQLLVPDPVYLPIRVGLPTALTRAVLRGPTSWLRPAVRNAVPAHTSLTGDVSLDAGIVRVPLSEDVLSAGTEQRQRLSAQLVWTLSQLPGFGAVEISGGGQLLAVPGSPAEQTLPQWRRYDPVSLVQATVGGYLLRDRRLLSLRKSPPTPVTGPFGTGRLAVRSVALSPVDDIVAGVSADGRLLYESRSAADSKALARLRGTSLGTPSWDALGRLWVVDESPSGRLLWVLSAGEGPRTVTLPKSLATLPHGAQVKAARISVDGTRIVMVVSRPGGSSVLLGRVQPRAGADGFAVAGLHPVAQSLVQVRDVAWRDSATLAVLGRAASGPLQPYYVSVEGADLQPRGSLAGIRTLAAAPGQPLLVGTADGFVWQQTKGLSYSKVSRGSLPIYPG